MPLLLLLLLLQAPPPDSLEVRRAAAAEQAAFERYRRPRLPFTLSASRCDVRVGRYCYWYDEDEPPAPAEPPAIALGRERLLEHLAAAAARAPGDRWIAGQLVRYLVEHGRPGHAVEAARACGAEPWWCAALEGFARHAAHDFSGAELAFERAAARMPEPVRCRWNDLEPLLERHDAGGYRRLTCAGRDSANAVLLTRSRPLLVLAGNDLATELQARRVFVEMQADAVTHHGTRMDPDLGELVLRYGWATAWSRRMERSAAGDGISVVGHEPRPAYPFLAAAATDNGPALWPPSDPDPRARYAPRYASAMVPLEPVQWARFARGDSVILVAAFAAPRDTLFTGPLRATLAAFPGRRITTPLPHGDAVLQLTAPVEWRVAAVEVEAPHSRAWAVNRVTAPDAGWPPAVSDLLLIAADSTTEPASLDDAVERALPDLHLAGVPVVGLYWETYPARARDQVATVRLEVIPSRPGFIGRVGRTLGLARRNPPISLTWEQMLPSGTGPVGHSVELDLSRLRPGRYDVVVEMRGEDGVAWVTAREISLARGRE